MMLVVHAFGAKDAAFDYLKKLQDNNVGPSASTGKLTALSTRANLRRQRRPADEHGADDRQPEHRVFWPPGRTATFAMPLPYYVGLVRGARRRQRQEADRLPALDKRRRALPLGGARPAGAQRT